MVLVAFCFCACAMAAPCRAQDADVHNPAAPPKLSTVTGPLRIAVIGLVHGHVGGLLGRAKDRRDITIVGVYEPDRALFDRLAAKYDLPPALYFEDLGEMLDTTRPECASVMTSIQDHRRAVEACAPRGVHTLLEKPLAFSVEDARAMAKLATDHGVLVLTNYETSWYRSVREAKRLVDTGQYAPIRRMAFRHGHKGPIEIGCPPEFTQWLTDPEANGGGAVIDFGCYGAILSTWLMNGQRPTSIVATRSCLKPSVYSRVDDDATIVLTYPSATAVIQASWAWTHDNKEVDIFTETGSLHAAKWDSLESRLPDKPPQKLAPAQGKSEIENEWVYLTSVVRGTSPVDPLSSIELNLICVEILDAARRVPIRSGPPAGDAAR